MRGTACHDACSPARAPLRPQLTTATRWDAGEVARIARHKAAVVNQALHPVHVVPLRQAFGLRPSDRKHTDRCVARVVLYSSGREQNNDGELGHR